MSISIYGLARAIVLAAVACLVVAPEGLGHGGIVKPPQRPERSGPGGGYTGPTDGSPPITSPADSGPTTGGGKPKPGKVPVTGGGRGPTTPGGGPSLGGPRTAKTGVGGKKRRAESGATWLAWWRANRDAFFAEGRSNGDALTGREGMLTGVGRIEDGGVDAGALLEAQSKILFGLRGVLGDADAEVVDSAVIAIARSVDPRFCGPLQRDLSDALRSDVRSVRQSAVLALGLLATDDAATTLRALLEGGARARELCGGNDVTDVDRGLAAMSLGMLSDRASVPAFVERLAALAGPKPIGRELAAGLILGAGAFTSEREAMAMSLGTLLDEARLPRELRALLPVSLGRLGSAAAPFVPRLLALGNDRDADLAARQSAWIALGRLCTVEDREVVAALCDCATNATDADLRHAALIALGEVTASAATALDERVIETFVRAIERPKSRDDVAWAALGAAQCIRARPVTAPERIALGSRLTTQLEQASDPEATAMFALALGLARAADAVPSLTALVRDADVAIVRACAAEGLGLIGDATAADAVREQLAREFDDEAGASQALALGALGDRRATALLLARVANADSARTLVASALALGRLRDPAAVDPLLELARDASKPGVARGFAAIALGLIGERSPVRWNARFCVGANVNLSFDVQTEVMDIL
ncbi:MAG: HEAT repeat domain-containing protein [Planctomycetes bacterium]|nr:HEAT repeat domain-containing protein [Planctomycetota bacterium]